MSRDVEILAGFHAEEYDDRGPFRWTQSHFEMRLSRAARFARLDLCHHGDRPLDEFLHEAFNGPVYQETRREPAAGRLSQHCRSTPSCPIHKRRQQQGLVQTAHNVCQRRALSTEPAPDEQELPLVPLEALRRRASAA